jgi:hypothetical protein
LCQRCAKFNLHKAFRIIGTRNSIGKNRPQFPRWGKWDDWKNAGKNAIRDLVSRQRIA